MYKLKDFDYNLPQELIAQYPLPNRTHSRLLILDRKNGRIEHRKFYEIVDYLHSGEVLVLNNTRVIPARLFGRKETGGEVEVFLLRELAPNVWESLLRPSSRLKKDSWINLNGSSFRAWVLDAPQPQKVAVRKISFKYQGDFWENLERAGHTPLPPYIRRKTGESDKESYQTVYAHQKGAVASPTAGLHFDQALLEKIKAKGIEILQITLHVGYGTFKPVRVENIKEHKMHEEFYEIKHEVAQAINQAKKEKRHIVACGTTVIRALESSVDWLGKIRPQRKFTNIFIYPPYKFKIVDSLITNFHLPRSTLLMLVSAFAGRENIRRAYQEAMKEKYRFYSYGDAMLII